jgi:hypothetical protein
VADDNIIETCRREAQAWINAGIGDGWPLTQAAAAIEAQQAEIERLRAERDAERALADDLYAVLSRLQPLTNGSSAQQRYLEARRG